MSFVARKLAFGMDWYTATSNSHDEIKAEAKRLKANVYTDIGGEMGRIYGFAELKKWKGVRSAAAVVADSLPEGGIFIHKISDQNKSCMIVIDSERRQPVLNMDMTGTREKMLAAAATYIKSNPDFAGKVYGDVTDTEMKGAHPLTLERISNDAVISGQLKPLSQIDWRIFMVGIGAVAVCAVLFMEDISALLQSAPEKPVETLEVQYKNQVRIALSEVVKANQFPGNVMGGFIPFLGTVAGEAAGWKIERLQCAATECEATWKRTPGATTEGFLRALNIQANDPSVSFYDVDYAKRKLSFKKLETERKLVIAPNSTFSEIVGSWLQGLSDRQLERPSIGTLSPIVPSNGAVLQAGDMPQSGSYQFTVKFTTQDLQAVAALPDMLTIETIEVTRGEAAEAKANIKFTGKYYAL